VLCDSQTPTPLSLRFHQWIQKKTFGIQDKMLQKDIKCAGMTKSKTTA